MRYSDARANIRSGDLLFWSHRGWRTWKDIQSQIVRMFTRSNYSHVGVALVLADRVFVLEAVGSGVRMFPVSQQTPFYWVMNVKQLNENAITWGFSQLGKAYESKLMMVINFIFFRNKSNSTDRLQCGEYVNGLLLANGQNLKCEDTPSAIMEAALKQFDSGLYQVTQ